MNATRARLTTTALALIATATSLAFGGQTYDLSWHTIDGGGGTVSGGAYELSGTLGQHDAGTMSGGGFELVGGFWAGTAPCGQTPGDVDGDGDADLADYNQFQPCLLGPGGGLGGGCECSDFDASQNVDLLDFAELQVTFTGNQP